MSGRQGADVRAAEARCTEAARRAGGQARGSRSQLAEIVTIMIPLPYCLERVFDGGPPGPDRGGHRRSGAAASEGAASGAGMADLTAQLARIWAMLAELDTALARRLRGYSVDSE